jgi:hypothetical protein
MTKRNSFFPLGGTIALGAMLALAGSAHAQTDILSATASSNLTSITIKGTGLLPPTGKPTVSLGSYALAVGSNFTNVQIVAALPASLKAGTYNLEVSANGVANFDVTIGSEGPAGPAGPAGPQGAPGTSMSLPFLGSIASPEGAVFTIVNTAGAGVDVLGGVTGGVGQAAIGTLGGGGSGATTGGPGFFGTGGTGSSQGGDGIDAFGGGVSGAAEGVGGYGVFATGGAGGPAQLGGVAIYAYGGWGDRGADGIDVWEGDAISSCYTNCYAGAGGTFTGGSGPTSGDGIAAFAGGNGASGIYAQGSGGATGGQNAGEFSGDVVVYGNLSKAGGFFKIDHPLDPANKYLYHSFVESPDMMNVYNGNVTTDGSGRAIVTLPDWFQALNSDFRYQLTTIGQPAHAWVASKVNQNAFAIRTDKPNVEVSWQVTGIRQDAWANAHRIPVEVEKDKADQGRYLHPELFEHAGEPSIVETHHPRPKKRQQQ